MAIGFSAGTLELLGPGLYRINLRKGFSTSHMATGLEKLAFEVLYCLMTLEGSIPYDPTFGTKVKALIGTFNIQRNTTLAATIIATEVVKCESQIRERQSSADIPAAEKLQSVILDSIEVVSDEEVDGLSNIGPTAIVRVILTNELGQSVGLELPNVGVNL